MSTRPEASVFHALTPERVLEAVEAAGLECRALCYPLNSFENRVYEVELEDRSRVIAKFYRPGRWSIEAILEEHAFVEELVDDEIPICPLRPFPDGSTLASIDGIAYSLSERRGGRAPDELSDSMVRRLGRLVARMHNVGARRPAPSRPLLAADFYIRRQVEFLIEGSVLPAAVEGRYVGVARELADLADDRMEGVPTHRVHADLHLGNVLEREGLVTLLDFDDFCTGPAVQDLWLALPGRGKETSRQREIFLEGYEEFRLFDRATLPLIECLRALRLVRYAAWIARRWDDPAFRKAWPDFGTLEYWSEQADDLERQLEVAVSESIPAVVDVPSASQPSEPEETLLSNKDYFFDWED